MNKAQDWHPADIIAAIKKRGTSLSALSRNAGLRPSTLNNALARRWPKGERRKAKGERRKDYCGFPECITG
ncbi:helix-turn-helix domain-containing protein [Morganella morganii]